MPPIELGPVSPPAARAVSAVETRPVTASPGTAKPAAPKAETGTPVANATARSHASANSAMRRSAALDAGPPPVDFERIAQIRKAIERGHYPVVPMRVADAMIAAGMLLRSGQ